MFAQWSGIALSLWLLAGCAPADPMQKLSGPAQGSSYNISFWADKPIDNTVLQQRIDTELQRIDLLMSNYRADSVIEQFNQQHSLEPVEVGAELVTLWQQALLVSKQSQGCYDLTVQPLFKLWGFKNNEFHQPTADELTATLQSIGMNKIQPVSKVALAKQVPNVTFDVSSIAQGWTVRQLATILEQAGIDNYLIEVGGELLAKGKKPEQQPWRVAIEKPLPGEQKLQKVISVQQNEALAIISSGTYRHYFDADGQRYSHVLDARRGAPVKHQTVSTTVIIDDATLGDAWSTALLCLGSEQGKMIADELGLAVLFIDQRGDELVEISSAALAEHPGVRLN